MSDEASAAVPEAAPGEPTAGALLREARERQGMHIAVLAASIKVPRAKLEALEGDRYDQLPDLTFARALAQAVCRALKIDAEPVLARLPRGDARRIEQLGSGLNAPFRERPGRGEPADWALLRKPAFWAVAAVLVATVVLGVVPDGVWRALKERLAGAGTPAQPASAPAAAPGLSPASAAMAAEPAPTPPSGPVMIETVLPASAEPAASDAQSAAPTAPAGIAVLRAAGETWIEVRDAQGKSLLSRTVQAGETVGLDGALPLRLTIGNAAATELTLRGQRVDLAPATRDNVARIELK
jgi:cytoskeleton protein RodZ